MENIKYFKTKDLPNEKPMVFICGASFLYDSSFRRERFSNAIKKDTLPIIYDEVFFNNDIEALIKSDKFKTHFYNKNIRGYKTKMILINKIKSVFNFNKSHNSEEHYKNEIALATISNDVVIFNDTLATISEFSTFFRNYDIAKKITVFTPRELLNNSKGVLTENPSNNAYFATGPLKRWTDDFGKTEVGYQSMIKTINRKDLFYFKNNRVPEELYKIPFGQLDLGIDETFLWETNKHNRRTISYKHTITEKMWTENGKLKEYKPIKKLGAKKINVETLRINIPQKFFRLAVDSIVNEYFGDITIEGYIKNVSLEKSSRKVINIIEKRLTDYIVNTIELQTGKSFKSATKIINVIQDNLRNKIDIRKLISVYCISKVWATIKYITVKQAKNTSFSDVFAINLIKISYRNTADKSFGNILDKLGNPKEEVYSYKNKKRVITAYKKNSILKRTHIELVRLIQNGYSWSEYNYAYKPGSSLLNLQNKIKHIPKKVFVAKIDISNFFNTIDHQILKGLIMKEFTTSSDVTEKLISKVSTHKKGLPIGFITSPILSDLFMKEFDSKISSMVNGYIRYADDILIWTKTKKDLIGKLKMIEEILRTMKLEINKSKTKIFNNASTNNVKFAGQNISTAKIPKSVINRYLLDAMDYYERNNYLSPQIIGQMAYIKYLGSKDYIKYRISTMRNERTKAYFKNLLI